MVVPSDFTKPLIAFTAGSVSEVTAVIFPAPRIEVPLIVFTSVPETTAPMVVPSDFTKPLIAFTAGSVSAVSAVIFPAPKTDVPLIVLMFVPLTNGD